MNFKTFAHQVVDILPKKLHQKDEDGNKEGKDQWPYEIFQDVAITDFHDYSLEIA